MGVGVEHPDYLEAGRLGIAVRSQVITWIHLVELRGCGDIPGRVPACDPACARITCYQAAGLVRKSTQAVGDYSGDGGRGRLDHESEA